MTADNVGMVVGCAPRGPKCNLRAFRRDAKVTAGIEGKWLKFRHFVRFPSAPAAAAMADREPKARAAPPQITSPLVLSLARYWERIRNGRIAPRWAEVDPGEIRGLLPYLMVSEVFGRPFDLRYRLAGTEVIASYGYNFTWMTLRSLREAPQNAAWIRLYQRVIEEQRPFFAQYFIELGPEGGRVVDSGIFPLSNDGHIVDRIIEIEDWSTAKGLLPAQVDPDVWSFRILE